MQTIEAIKAVSRIGAHRILRALQGSAVTVLMYHGVVADDCMVAEDDWLQVKESDFREQMGFLSEHYEVLPLDRAWESKSGTSSKPRAVITFDDGYANNYHVAYPILREFGLPATIFLVTGAIGSRNLFWYDRLQTALKGLLPIREIKSIREDLKARIHPHAMNAAVDALLREKIGSAEPTEEAIAAYRPLDFPEIKEMGRSGSIRFGSHTHRHEILTKMTRAEVEETLARSLEVLRGLPGASDYFCYPNGSHGPGHDEILRRLGFAGAVRVGGRTLGSRHRSFSHPPHRHRPRHGSC
ncbi:MAG TPA: polysaccharide deacetylase family protein [Methylococcus sp.]|nr:polysaccharide deacetylase family protein [Methylococcus sp.]